MYDTLVYYAYVKQYMEASKMDPGQSDVMEWDNLNPHLNYVGESLLLL